MSGKVTYSDDGSPLDKGMVVFTDGITQSRGTIQKNGLTQSDCSKKNTVLFLANTKFALRR
ncbi:MAG: hypothetical protein LBC74_07840 [Planctomycetaceae bacterium]|nr:hypothetical protein [Planctomycetaceae bacterium]